LKYILDFNSQVIDSIEAIFAQGLKKAGRYRRQWKEDKNCEYHVKKAIGHLEQFLVDPIDKDTGEPHISNAIARLMIALYHYFKELKK